MATASVRTRVRAKTETPSGSGPFRPRKEMVQPHLNHHGATKEPALGARVGLNRDAARAIRIVKTRMFSTSEPGLDGEVGRARELFGIRGDDGETKVARLGGERTLARIVAHTPRRHPPPLTDADCLCAPALAQVLCYVTCSQNFMYETGKRDLASRCRIALS